MKKTKILLLFVLLIAAGIFTVAASAQQEQQILADKLVRLHVVANSDTAEDQQLKLQVRDAVLTVTDPLVSQAGDPRQALEAALPKIKAAAVDCLKAQNSPYSVTVSLGPERFPTRYYDNFALPAGVYPALRVVIGAGEGRNWWCVAFPSICLRATTADLENVAVSAGFTEQEVRLITEASDGYVLKFKVWELLGEIKSKLFP